MTMDPTPTPSPRDAAHAAETVAPTVRSGSGASLCYIPSRDGDGSDLPRFAGIDATLFTGGFDAIVSAPETISRTVGRSVEKPRGWKCEEGDLNPTAGAILRGNLAARWA